MTGRKQNHVHSLDDLFHYLNGIHPGSVLIACRTSCGDVATEWEGEKEKRREKRGDKTQVLKFVSR